MRSVTMVSATRVRTAHLALLLATSALTAPAVIGAACAQSLPTGGSVAAGSASVSQPSSTTMTINQTSQSAVVNWQSFSIGQGYAVNVVQPGASAALLNRVTGDAPSTIAGALTANGQVYLVNPNGIAITPTGTVNVGGGFVASTLGISDADFMNGKRGFAGNGASAAVSNAGTISVGRGGYAALIGGTVSNTGNILVPLGKVGLGSGEQAALDFSGDGFLQVALPTKAASSGALVENAGTIKADGGAVVISAATAREAARNAVNISGLVQARSIGGRTGAIEIGGGEGGAVAVSGQLTTASKKAKGGSITVTAKDITLTGAKLDASGKTGGGSIRVGGDRQGTGTLAHAETVTIDAATTIKADARQSGNGGNVVVWSDRLTSFAGTISARGGAAGGNGGDAEVSGKARLAYTGFTDLSAAKGRFGNLLLDPYNVTISTGADVNQSGFTATGDDSVINAATLTAALSAANVTVSTGGSGTQNGDITLATALSWTAASTLTLNAAGNIALNGAVTASNGGLTLSSGGTISATAGVNVGTFTLSAGDWAQNNATLPSFAATNFVINGGTFLRVTGGDGSGATPYQVADLYGLQGIGSSSAYLNASWRLVNDIDAAGTASWNGGAGFRPIGTDFSTSFGGAFDGNGHTISGLTVSGYTYAGLFGATASPTASISNVGLVGGSFSGTYAGALAGSNNGTISHSYATGFTVNGNAGGGLAGDNGGTIINSSATGGMINGTVRGIGGGLVGTNEGTIANSYASNSVVSDVHGGGLVGWNSGAITSSYATGSVSGSGSNQLGGLVGYNVDSGAIVNSYATGSVTGSNTAGGLVGFNRGRISNSYATNTVTAGFAGGLVGDNEGGGWISSSYATGAVVVVTSGYNIAGGGLVGYNGAFISNSFWDKETTGQSSACGICYGSVSATGLTTAQARNASSYTGWDFGAVWYQSGDMRPILRSEAAAADSNGVIAVNNLHQLALIGANLAGNYKLGANIDASETSGANAAGIWSSTSGWVPLGDNSTAFSGSFDGSNHTISGLTASGYLYAGLFGISNGSISNVGLVGGSFGGVDVGALAGANGGAITNSYATGVPVYGNFAGGLVGENVGTITNSRATGTVGGVSYAGGLVGYNWNIGTITNSYASGAVSSYGSFAGGLAGGNAGTIGNSYASGAVSGLDTYTMVGGLVGYNAGTISNSYAIGAVSGSGHLAGLTGQNDGTVTASFWDTTTTGQAYGTNGGFSSGMTGLTTAQMKDPFTFINAGWDFAGVWGKSTSGANGGHMMLRSLSSGLYDDYIAISSGTRTYGDANNTITGAMLSGVGTGNVTLAWGSAITGTTNAGTYNYSAPDIVSLTESAGRTAYVDTSGTLTIARRAITVTADTQSRVYGDANPALTYGVTSGNLVNGDTLTGGLATVANAGSNVGSYAITLGTLAASSNYDLSYAGANLAVSRRTITVTVNDVSRAYGDANVLTYGIGGAGLVNGDTLSGSLATTATTTSNVGLYAITQGTLAASSNYSLTGFTGATLNVTQRPITVTADAKTKFAGEANPALTYTLGGAGLVNGDTLGGALATTADANSAVGSYAITQGTIAAPSANYRLTYVGASLTVQPRAVATYSAVVDQILAGIATPIQLPAGAMVMTGAPRIATRYGTAVFYADPRWDRALVCFGSTCFAAL